MAELFKNIYNKKFFSALVKSIREVKRDFAVESFLPAIFSDDWDKKELKQRMRHITLALRDHLGCDFNENVETLLDLIPVLKKNGFRSDNLEFIFLPDFIAMYGLGDFKTSMKAFEIITQFVSCEFGVRPFIMQNQDLMMEQMLTWSGHDQASVRRLASEGSRPRLPWAMALPALKKDPASIIPILETLKNDRSKSVRRSVANNLNDISKDHPGIVISLVEKWLGSSDEVDAVCKHGCRTLLKKGNRKVLELFGFGPVDQMRIEQFKIVDQTVSIGGQLEFSFRLINTSRDSCRIRLEYAIYYQKANGTLSKKVYKISEKEYLGNSNTFVKRKQSFRVITTRKFHLGRHQVSMIVNGKEFDAHDFQLVNTS